MYNTNSRTIRFSADKAPIVFHKGLITKKEYAASDDKYTTIENVPYAIARRLFVWAPIEVLKDAKWIYVGDSNFNELEKAYSDEHVCTHTVVESAPQVIKVFTQVEEPIQQEQEESSEKEAAEEESTVETESEEVESVDEEAVATPQTQNINNNRNNNYYNKRKHNRR